jgi:ABC-type glycerol-3-phosphate transport system permease component
MPSRKRYKQLQLAKREVGNIAAYIISSFKPIDELNRVPATYYPKNFTLRNYYVALQRGFGRFFLNSVIISSCVTFLVISISSLSAYILSRYAKLRGVSFMAVIILALIMLPASVVIIPLFIIWSRVKLTNTYFVLIITYTAFQTPFCSLLLKGFFDTISVSIEESAWIDGASKLQSLLRVVMPISAPGLISVGFFAFVLSWQELLFALILIYSEKLRPLTFGLMSFFGERFTDWGSIMAGCTITILPVLIGFAFFERYLIAGMTAGALKA